MELMVVVSIVGILAIALGAGFMGWREQYNAESDIKKLHGALMDAKISAMKDMRYYFINVPHVPEGESNILRIYRDTDASDPDNPDKPGDGILQPATDRQHGEDMVFNNRLDLLDKYRHLWFNAQGHLKHENDPDPGQRDFQIRLKQWDSEISAQSDFNCLRVSPPFYVAGGIWNATEENEKDLAYRNTELRLDSATRKRVTPSFDYPLCTVK